MMNAANTSRQFATGLAAFFITALLLLANSPGGRTEDGLRLQRSAAVEQVQAAFATRG